MGSAPPHPLHLNYIGSKRALWPSMVEIFSRHIGPDTTFVDAFAGTGTVARNVHETFGCPVVANDLQYYSYVLCRALLTRYSDAEAAVIQRKIEEYNALAPQPGGPGGFFAEHYGPPARRYFTPENARKIDAIRGALEADRAAAAIGESEYYYLLASLVVAADDIANVASVYGAFLKEFKASARRPLQLRDFLQPPVRRQQADVCCMDVAQFIDHTESITTGANTVVYLDPPYSVRSYQRYYHLLETLARGDAPAIHGVTGMRDDARSSPFSLKATAVGAFADLFERLRVRGVGTVMVSYSSDGIVGIPELEELLRTRHGGRVTTHHIPYRKLMTKAGGRSGVNEFILVSTK